MAFSPIVGAFVFPEFWKDAYRVNSKLAHLRDCGVNAIMAESESYELPILNAAHKAGLRFFAGVACFSDHASDFRSLRKRPELWPVLENGERRPQMEWYVGGSKRLAPMSCRDLEGALPSPLQTSPASRRRNWNRAACLARA